MSSSSYNVASHLARMAAEQPTQVAIHFPRRHVKRQGHTVHRAITYAELNADVDAIAHGLTATGISRGMRTVLMVPPTPDFFAVTFALFKIAAIPVLIDPGMGMRNLGRCLEEAEPQAFIGVTKANLARLVLGWGRKTIGLTVNVGRWPFFCRTSLARLRRANKTHKPFAIPDVGRDEPAAILFTSGSTGIAKGAVYTHGNFAAQVELLKATYGIESGEIDLCTFPLFALFGPALGMTCVIPDMNPTRPASINPRKAVAQIRQFGVTNLFGSPAVIRRLGADGSPANPESLASVRRVISAGAPASAKALEQLARRLPASAEIYTPYGATEALPVANIGSREILGETRSMTETGKGVCVGRPVAGVEVSVIRITDEPIHEWDDALRLPVGEVGEFVIRGPMVTRHYYNRHEATKLAKIRDPQTGDILHRMGDVGYMDARGRLWFCGRKAHRVETPSGTLFTDMIEPIFNAVPGVFRTALVGVRRDGVTHPVLCVEFEGRIPRDFPESLRQVAASYKHTQVIRTFLYHPHFPVDVRHNSKIFREKLAVWADKTLGRQWQPKPNDRLEPS